MHDALILTCGLIVVYWLLVTAKVIVVQRMVHWLHPLRAPALSAAISVMIPARNEERDLAASLRTVLDQEGVDLEVVVVNDHSTDRTGQIADSFAREDMRVKVVHDPPLLAGWLGKSNAMSHGAAVATKSLLLFSDADVYHARTCFATAMDTLQRENLDAISLCPRWENKSFWEQINVPIYYFGVARLMTPEIEDTSSRAAVASGALILVKSDVFAQVGGFESVRGEMLDDVAFARLLKGRGFRFAYRLAPECLSVRLFKGSCEAFLGTTKNILAAAGNYAWLGLPLIGIGIVQHWAPILALILGFSWGQPFLACAGLVAYLTQYGSFFTAKRLINFHALPVLCYPLASVVASVNIVRALYYHSRGRIFWRGRAIRITGKKRLS